MATGENSGTWGTVTNTNLGTAIEEAIVGSADVSFADADVTLTLTNTNSSQTARNLRLNLGGAISSAKNLIVPAIEKEKHTHARLKLLNAGGSTPAELTQFMKSYHSVWNPYLEKVRQAGSK